MIRRWVSAWPLDARDHALVAGFAAIVIGVSQVSPPAAWITAGVLLLAFWLFPYALRKGPN